MSVYMYDDAIIQEMRGLVHNDSVYIVPFEESFNLMSRVKDDSVKLPLIHLTRVGWSIIADRESHPQIFTGAVTSFDQETLKMLRHQTIPIRIDYQLDVITRNRLDNDLLMRELIFYFKTHSSLEVLVPYGLNFRHKFNVFLSPDVDDNSDITQFSQQGQYFRQTMGMYTDDAYLWKSSNEPVNIVDPDDVSLHVVKGDINNPITSEVTR